MNDLSSIRQAAVFQHGTLAGILSELEDRTWNFTYTPEYSGEAVSLTLPVQEDTYPFPSFPSVFEGLLPEGPQLEALLRTHKIDRNDPFAQLIVVGSDLVGSLTIEDRTQD